MYVATIVLAACGGTGAGESSDSSGTEPSATGVSPSGFCAKLCIAEDRDRCMPFATRFSDAFLAAFQTCGDDPACLQPKLDVAPRTPRQEKLAADYCTRCGETSPTCAETFFVSDQPGGSLAMMSDARLDAIEEACFADLEGKGEIGKLTCRVKFSSCALPFLQEDVGASVSCRQRR